MAQGRFVQAPRQEAIELNGLLALPGLINAHDHLEFALFPRLGGGRQYSNAKEWAQAIYRPQEPPIRECLRVPKEDRLIWGGLRNLFGGVTTVCHHNPYDAGVFEHGFPMRVIRDVAWAHSLDFGVDVTARFAGTTSEQPFVIHAAEGVDEAARAEIEELEALGVLSDRTVIVHATACGEREWSVLRERGCGVVWCPSSNDFLFGRTLAPGALRRGIPVALGTDSPLTAAGGMFEELASAQAFGASPDELYSMVTDAPARMLRLWSGAGTLEPGAPADWIALRDRGLAPCEALLEGPELELAFVAGEPKLVSQRLADEAPELTEGLTPIRYGHCKFWVCADASGLVERARAALGGEVRLGGVAVQC